MHGRTVLFVSHNMTAIKALCTRAILIEKGQVALDGDVDQIVDRYLKSDTDIAPDGHNSGGRAAEAGRQERGPFRSVQLSDLDGNGTTQLYLSQAFFRVDVRVRRAERISRMGTSK